MDEAAELALDGLGDEEFLERVRDAIDLASDQGQPVWLTLAAGGKRVAAIVPVDVLEAYQAWLAGTARPERGRHRRVQEQPA